MRAASPAPTARVAALAGGDLEGDRQPDRALAARRRRDRRRAPRSRPSRSCPPGAGRGAATTGSASTRPSASGKATVSGPSTGVASRIRRSASAAVMSVRTRQPYRELPLASRNRHRRRRRRRAPQSLTCPKFGQPGHPAPSPTAPPRLLEGGFPGSRRERSAQPRRRPASDPRCAGVTLENNLVLAPMAGVSNLPVPADRAARRARRSSSPRR